MLQKPERRVRELVVEPAEVGRIVPDEAQPVARAVAAGLLERTAGLVGDRAVLLAERVRDPGDVVQGDERRERGDEAASTAAGTPTGLVTREGERPPVGDDDQSASLGHRVSVTGFGLGLTTRAA